MFKSLSFKLFVNLLIKFLGIFLGVYTTRWLVYNLDSTLLESYNLILSYSAILLSVINLGIPTLVQKYYTNEKDPIKQKTYWVSLGFVRIVSYFIGLTIILIASNWVFTSQLVYVLLTFTSQFIILADLNFRSVCDANNISWKFSLTDGLGKLLLAGGLLVGGVFLSSNSDYLFWYLICSIFAYTVGILVDFFWQWKYTGFSRISWSFLQVNLKNLFYLGLSGIMVNLYFTTDRLFLKYFGNGPEVINGYVNAYKVFELSLVIPGLTMPIFASMARRNIQENHSRRFAQFLISKNVGVKTAIGIEWLLLTIVFGVALAIGLFTLSSLGIWLIDPDLKYPLALQALPILALSHIVYSTVYFLASVIVFFEKEHYEVAGVALIAIFAITSYFLLIPRFGLIGAASATLLTFIFDFCIKVATFWRILHLQDRVKS